MVNIDFGLQPLVLAFEPLHVPGILHRLGCKAGNGCHQLEMIFVKANRGIAGNEVDEADCTSEDNQGDRQQRVDLGVHQTLGSKSFVLQNIIAQKADAFSKNTLDDAATHLKRTVCPQRPAPT